MVGAIPSPHSISAENGIAIVTSPSGTFTAGDIFTTGVSVANNANDAIYKNGSLFIDGISA